MTITAGRSDVADFEAHRRALMGLAYRMLGSRAEAEDVVQDAYLRWHAADRAAIDEPRRYLGTVVTRLCLDRMKSARARRESYVGQWLPEPVIDEAFDDATAGEALYLAADGFLASRRVQLATLAARYGVPTAQPTQLEFVKAGGLMSYGASIAETYRQVGLYTGRIIRGTKPAHLPVVQPTKFELAINLQTARLLGIEVPASLLAIADDVIE